MQVARQVALRIALAVGELGAQDARGAGTEQDRDALCAVFCLCL
jgi:hypothetical protein